MGRLISPLRGVVISPNAATDAWTDSGKTMLPVSMSSAEFTESSSDFLKVCPPSMLTAMATSSSSLVSPAVVTSTPTSLRPG